jgi:murein DD-endopeptidase MepM/ murein hydrolase activator NlpD
MIPLQGNSVNLQGGYNPMGSVYNPQVAISPVAPPSSGSLVGTMAKPPTPPAQPVPKPQSTPTPQVEASQVPTRSPSYSGGSFNQDQSMEPNLMAKYLDTMRDKLKANNELAIARGLLVKALYDSPLTPEEVAKLPPNIAKAVESGEKKDIELQIRLLNDQLKGRTNTLDQSVEFLTKSYNTYLDRMEAERQNAINNILNFAQIYGEGTGDALRSLYGNEYVDKLRGMGIDVDNFSSLKTLAEKKSVEEGMGLTPAQINSTVNGIRSAFRNEQIVKDYNEIVNKYNTISQIVAAGGNGGPDDLALIFEFMKSLDPTSVVREGEYATAAKSGNPFKALAAKIGGYLSKGQILPQQVRDDFVRLSKLKMGVIEKQYKNLENEYNRQIQDVYRGVPQTTVNYDSALGGGGGDSADEYINRVLGFNSAGNALASKPYLSTLGPITGANGSSLWKYGLDVDLKVGDPVLSPVNGTVIYAGKNGGFGNQIKIRDEAGNEIWFSHLASGNVKVGQKVRAGQKIALGGNTGNTIAGPGGDGSHLDITMKNSKGQLLSAPAVQKYLSTKYV